MCTLFLLINQIKNIPIAIISNRDENLSRKSSIIQVWDSRLKYFGNEIISPRDEVNKGTWFACQNKMNGKWAILTNIMDVSAFKTDLLSRGEIILNFLNSNNSSIDFLKNLNSISDKYNLFNIIFSDSNLIYYYHSKTNEFILLHNIANPEKKIFGLSTDYLDSKWEKIIKSKQKFLNFLQSNNSHNSDFYWKYFSYEMMEKDKSVFANNNEKNLNKDKLDLKSSLFVRGSEYGTRSTLFFGLEQTSMFFYEQTYNRDFKVDMSKKITINFYDN